MQETTSKQKLQEVHQGIFGVLGTDDKGLIGDIREIKNSVCETNGKVRKLTIRFWFLLGLIIGTGVLTLSNSLGFMIIGA